MQPVGDAPAHGIHQGMIDGIYEEEEVLEAGVGGVVYKMDVEAAGFVEVMVDGRMEVVRSSRLVEARRSFVGVGLFALERMPSGCIVQEYTGRFVPTAEGDEIEAERDRAGFRGDYMVETETGIIDGSHVGGAARFANHSCVANCVLEEKNFLNSQKALLQYNENRRRPNVENICHILMLTSGHDT